MTTDRRQRVLELYHQALGMAEADRNALLLDACAGDEELHRHVQSMLAHDPPDDFLGGPPENPAPDLIGRQIGPYRVDSRLGAGGMGEVFRAHDTKLGRDVAIKILPRVFGADPERRARFEREARLLATLNHPHIGAIYGFEDGGGVPALVLELVDGETLTQHLRSSRQSQHRGLPVAHAVAVAQQIAEALEAAHEKGIVHRDLKPGNIVFTADGSVKVLDFGLAKAMSDSGLEPPAADTRTGVVMGTPAYMSPEQAKGAKVDKRADVWAFGCVLFEMLTGRPAFAGATMAETLAAVLHEQPVWETLPVDTPPGVRLVLMQCLQKDPKQRVRDVGDVKLALTGVFTSDAARAVATPAALSRLSLWRRVGPVVAALIVGVLGTVLAMRLAAPRTVLPVTRLSLGATGPAALHINGNEHAVTITPDGSRVVYVGDDGRQVFVRALDTLQPVSLVTGGVLRNPFVSPDGRWVGFGEDISFLKKVPASGGPAIPIARMDSIVRGAVWLPDNTIVFATSTPVTGLQRVSADGGMPTTLTTPDSARNEYDHLWPELLPDGRAILYTMIARTGGLAAAKVRILDLQTNTSSDLLSGASNAVYVSSGHLIYVAGRTLWAVRFDPNTRTTFGTAAPVLNDLVTTGNGAGTFALSRDGTLVYGHAVDYDPFARTLSWIDRRGRVEPIPAPPHPYMQLRISNDGTRIATTSIRDPEDNLWVWDLARRVLTRVTTGAALDVQPDWTPDDRWIVFGSNRDGSQHMWRQAADGTGLPERLAQQRMPGSNPSVTPDGKRLLFSQPSAAGDADIVELNLDTGQVTPVVPGASSDAGGVVSPDGHWLAFNSDRSGRLEIYVQPYPNNAGGRWQVSTAGGRSARWARDSRELFFIALDGALMGAAVRAAGARWMADRPVKVLEPGYWSRPSLIAPNYDVASDGRFLVLAPPLSAQNPPELLVVQHWDQELRVRVPSK